MFNFFDSIIDFFSSLWQMISNMFSGLITMINVLVQTITIPFSLSTLVPSFVYTCIGIVSAIGIVKLLVGWGNSQ